MVDFRLKFRTVVAWFWFVNKGFSLSFLTREIEVDL